MNQPKRTATYTIINPLEHKTQIPLNFCKIKEGFFYNKNTYTVRPAVVVKPARQLKKKGLQELCYYPAKHEYY